MKPHRVRMTHELVSSYGLLSRFVVVVLILYKHVVVSCCCCGVVMFEILLSCLCIRERDTVHSSASKPFLLLYCKHRMKVCRPRLCTSEEMELFHSPEYVSFLKDVNVENTTMWDDLMKKCL